VQLGIFAKTFAGEEPVRVLQQARVAGFSAVQYNMACSGLGSLPHVVTAGQASKVAQAVSEARVEVAALSATYNMIDPVPARRDAGRRSFAALAQAARPMGTDLLTVCTGSRDAEDQWRHHPDNEGKAAWAEMLAEFELLLAIAERENVRIGIEPELGNVVSSAAKAKRLLDQFDSPRLCIVIDAANLFERAGHDEQRRIVTEAIELLSGAIVLAHAKDRAADGSVAAAGFGILDWPHYLGSLHKCGFDGPLVTHGLAAAEAPAVAAFLSRQLAAIA
jgi:sugar phosphate isomerase/epimerase